MKVCGYQIFSYRPSVYHPIFRFSMLFTLLDYYSTMVKIDTQLRSSYKGTHWILSICYYMEIGMANVTVEIVAILVCHQEQEMQGSTNWW